MEVLAQGTVRKMRSRLLAPVSYSLPLGDAEVELNELIAKKIKLEFLGDIHCVHCGRKTSKSFNQGHCYPCFQNLAQCDSCIIHPERCHHAQGTCREPGWGEKYCMQDHIIYLANSSGLKVGITRATQVPTRWVDQGATQALPIIRVRTRLQSGLIETMFKQHVADKTNWRDMLKGSAVKLDMASEAARLLELCDAELKVMESTFGYFAISVLRGLEPVAINYPVTRYLEKIASYNFDKDPFIESTLLGIKGQYLIFEDGVINMRRFSGYNVSLSH
jgi:hypothetical protein